MKIVVIGTGSFGSTMAIVAANNLIEQNSKVELWVYVRRKELFDELNKNRIHPNYPLMSEVIFPKNIIFSDNIEDVIINATHLIFAVPSKYAVDTLGKLKGLNKECKIISLVKGFYIDHDGNFMRISTLINRTLDIRVENICTLSGPNIYWEIAQNYAINPVHKSCNTVVSSVSSETAQDFQKLFFSKNILRTYYSNDVVTSEISGALKNIIAIMCGIADGYNNKSGRGINFKASLITRAATEFGYFSRSFGGDHMSAYGMAGLGDLIATCMSGRNRLAGEMFVSGMTVLEVQNAMFPNEIEGFQTLTVINKYLNNLRNSNPDVCIELPLVEGIYQVVFENAELEEAINKIINRPLKKELRNDPFIKFQ